ncbi:MAG: nuclear transport factor 2 family protein [Acidobacteriota bacterium]
MYLLSVLLVLLSFQGTSAPSEQTAEAVVTQIEQRFTTALLKKDDVAVGDLLADDLVHISFDGQAVGKTEYLAFFKQGVWQYRKYEPTNVKVKVFGHTAVVTGRVNREIVISGQETIGAFAFTHVWLRSGDRWRLTSSQVTTIPNPIS